MKTTLEMAREFLRVRCEWLRRSSAPRDSAVSRQRLVESESEMRTLAWALDVDLRVMNAPKVGVSGSGFVEAQTVRVQKIDEYGCWMVEIPRNDDPGFRTEYCALLVADRHMRELGQAIGAALVTRRPALSGRLAAISPIRAGCVEGEAGWAVDAGAGGGDLPSGA